MSVGRALAAAIGLVTALGCGIAVAATSVAGVDFEDDAFADTILSSAGGFGTIGTLDLGEAVLGSNVTTFADFSSSASTITLGFADNLIVNGAGDDLVIFDVLAEAGGASASITVAGTTLVFTDADFIPTGFNNAMGLAVTALALDLDDFAIASAATVDALTIAGEEVELAAVGALNSASIVIPLPPTLWLLVTGLLGLLGLRRLGQARGA